jgi:biotin transporter BioY
MLMLKNSWNKRLNGKHSLVAGAFLLLVILGAKIDLDLGGTVSFTLQTLFLGLAYFYLPGPWKLVFIAVYLSLGIAGFSVFNGGAGWDYFSSWPLGFFVGFILAAVVPKPTSNTFFSTLVYITQIQLVIVLLGVMWLAYFTGSFSKGLETLAELVPGIVIKSLTGAGVVGLVKGFKKA